MKRLFLILALGSFISCNNKPLNSQTSSKDKLLPAFDVLLMDSTTRLNTGKIPEGKPTVLLFFSPDCPFCRELTKDIVGHIDEFKNAQIFFLSSAPFRDIKTYDTLFKLNSHNIIVGQDYTGFFFSYFKGNGIPYLVIYDKKKKLKKIILGSVGIDYVRNIVNS